jgi:hypothetical protein
LKSHASVSETFRDLKDSFDSYVIFDNSLHKEPPTIIAYKDEEGETIIDEARLKIFYNKGMV